MSNNNHWPAAAGYEHLAEVLKAAHDQAAYGKGKERHANDLPFHDQRMQSISTLLGDDRGMAFQAIKKLTEGLEFADPARREAELLGAINYIAGILVWHARKNWATQDELYAVAFPAKEAGPDCDEPEAEAVDWDKGEQRIDTISQNGPTGEHYAVQVPGIGQAWPEQGGIYAGRIEQDGELWHLVFAEQDLQDEYEWDEAIKAAQIDIGGFSDWRLPTRHELIKAWERESVRNTFAEERYWSSSQSSTYYAWHQSFTNGYQYCHTKGYSYRVRPVRRFKIENLEVSDGQ